MDIYTKPNKLEVTMLKEHHMIIAPYTESHVLKTPIQPASNGNTLTIDFNQLGFNIGHQQDTPALTDLLCGLIQGMKCTDRPEWLEFFLHEVGDRLEVGHGKREDLKFLELMWLDKEPNEIVFK